MSELPAGWVETKIGDLCELINGRAFKPEDWGDKGLPIVRIQNLNRPKSTFNYYDGAVRDRFLIDDQELLFAWSGTPGTSFGAHIWTGGKAVLNQHIFKILFNAEMVDRVFLKHAINQTLEEQIGKAHGGVGLRHVTKGKFEDTALGLPPLPEQRRIVAKVAGLTARSARARADLSRIPTLIARYKQRLLALAFSGELTAEWRVKCDTETEWKELPLSDLASVGTGATPKRGTPEYYEGGTIPWVTSGVVNEDVVLRADQWITPTAIKETNCKVFPSGTMLVAMYGEGKTRGKVAILGLDAATNQALAAIQLRARVVTDRFVFWFFKSNYLKLREQAAGGVQPNLSIGLIKQLAVPIPSLEEQAEIVRRIESAFGWLDRMAADHAAAARLIPKLDAAILTKAFEGTLVPQDPTDEPASVLLERIRGEQGAALKKKAKEATR